MAVRGEASLVFADAEGLPLRPGSVTVAFEAHVAACGLPVIRLDDTRHGACSLLAAGATTKGVQAMLRHSRESTTSDLYVHVLESVRKGTADRTDGVLRRVATFAATS